jgi:CTP-dependent riboflavin kinase
LILRTATNYHKDDVLEIMAEEHLRSWLPVIDGDEVEVTIFANLSDAKKALKSE